MALTLVDGLVGGLVAALVMGVLMMGIARGQPGPPAMVVARATGKRPEDAKKGGMLAHLAYGTIMGGVFVLGTTLVLSVDSLLGLDGVWLNGILFGILLFLIFGMFIMPAALTPKARASMPKSRAVGALVAHVVYGLVLAAVVTFVHIA